MTVALDIIGISIQLVSTFLAALAYVWQKKAHLRMALNGNESWSAPENKSAQRLWRLGFALMVVAACLDLATYPMLDLSKQAPLGAVTLVFNSILASILLSEPFTVLDLISTVMIFAGTITAVANSEAESATWTFDQILGLLDDNLVKIYSAVMIPGLLLSILFVERTSKVAPVTWTGAQRRAMAFLAPMAGGCCMGFTGYFAKSLSTVVSQLDFPALKNPIFWLYALLAGIAVTGQLRYLNKGLAFFDALQVVPIFQCFIIFSNALAGIVYFHDMRNSEPYKLILFAVGGGVCIAGIALLLLKKTSHDSGHAAVVVVAAASKESRRESLVGADGTVDPWAAPGAIANGEQAAIGNTSEFSGYKPSAPESLSNPAEIDLMSSLQRRIWGAQSRAKAAVIGLYQTAAASATSSTGTTSNVVASIMPQAAGYSNPQKGSNAASGGGDDDHHVLLGDGLSGSEGGQIDDSVLKHSNSSGSGSGGNSSGLLSSLSRRRSAGAGSQSPSHSAGIAQPLQHSAACNQLHSSSSAGNIGELGSPGAFSGSLPGSPDGTLASQCPACAAGFPPGTQPPPITSSASFHQSSHPPLHPPHHGGSFHHGHHHGSTVTSSNGNVVGSVPSFRRSTTSRDITGRSRAGSISASVFAAFSTAISMSDVVAAASAAETIAAAQTATGLPPSMILHPAGSGSTPSAQQSPRLGGLDGSGAPAFPIGGDGSSEGGISSSNSGSGAGIAISVRARGRSRVNTGGSLAAVEEESGGLSAVVSPVPQQNTSSSSSGSSLLESAKQQGGYGTTSSPQPSQGFDFGSFASSSVSGAGATPTTTINPPPGLMQEEADPWAASGSAMGGSGRSADSSRQNTGGSGLGFSTPQGPGTGPAASYFSGAVVTPIDSAAAIVAPPSHYNAHGSMGIGGSAGDDSPLRHQLSNGGASEDSQALHSRQSSFSRKTKGKAWHEIEVKDIVQAGWKRYGPGINKFLGRKPTTASGAASSSSSASSGRSLVENGSAAAAGVSMGTGSSGGVGGGAGSSVHAPSTPTNNVAGGRASGPRGSAGGSYSSFE